MSFASTRLKRVARVVAGQAPSSDAVSDNGAMPFIQGCAEFGASNPQADKFCDHAPKRADKGDWLISVRAPVGRLNIADQRYGIGRGLAAVKPERINGRFLGYAITHAAPKLSGVATGSTYEAVSGSDIGNMLVPLPDLDTQKAIADFLDKETARIDQLIEKKQRLVELLGERELNQVSLLVSGRVDHAVQLVPSGLSWLPEIPVHWSREKGMRIGAIIGSSQGAEVEAEVPGTIPYLKVSDLLDFDGRKVERTNSSLVPSGEVVSRGPTIVFPKRGAAIFTNKASLIEGRFALDPNLMGWSMRPGFAAEYYLAVLKCRRLDDLADVSTVPQINNKHIYPQWFPKPPLNEQHSIARRLQSLQGPFASIRSRIFISIDRLKEYRSALITAAVTGQIDVTRWGQTGEGDKRLDQIQEEMAG
ncbi:MAG: restriction endonuclease subunit S [Maricaulis sp.]|uniref:restriction endonuclease subunit S n=1 Tax=Maricaulis sp. TaxID=1486257 RepID=UPI001B2DE9CF|nr:restriction endonuclease subunit S [Maricaulis sp.]MBO6728235.1 restriction endonuclease subunit S [Maricaulis sp.]MBO6847249.1 restriction endonuclease subunit S [Maricaulis sp.]MBO6876552.1 restriction endonuclease subunit S [Maricaulis sp.]